MPADAVLDSAVDLAREAAIDAAESADAVGDHLSVTAAGERLSTHQFACTLPGYRGWVWAVTVARAPRAREATVCEAHLVPADDALLAPSWVPWADRVRPGDLEPSMVLPKIVEDPRLMPGYSATGDPDTDEIANWELGLGRERVLAPEGRDSAADRWARGSHGSTAASAIASAAPCSTCAFFVPLSGSMRMTFGACANEWSPSDGRVVSVDHGCGAHSQTDVEKQASRWPEADPVIDTDASDALDLNAPDPIVIDIPEREEQVADEPAAAAAEPESATEVAEPPAEDVAEASAEPAAPVVDDAAAEDAVADVPAPEPAAEPDPAPAPEAGDDPESQR